MAAQAPDVQIGFKAPDFALPAIDGRRIRLSDIAGKKGTVVAFICNHCPYVQAIADRLARDAADLAPVAVTFVAINANDAIAYPEDSFENMKAFAAQHGFYFPYLHDETQQTAKAYGAVCTPDLFGFDADLKLKYRGRLDASRATPGPLDAKRELYEAMVQIAETGAGPAVQHPALGCSIKWRDDA